MKFKGTKGNWRLANNEYGYYTSVRNLEDTRKVCVSRVNNQIESNANMLLISKAPEMLDMLGKCIDMFLDLKHDKNLPELQEIQDELEQLIKEATEI